MLAAALAVGVGAQSGGQSGQQDRGRTGTQLGQNKVVATGCLQRASESGSTASSGSGGQAQFILANASVKSGGSMTSGRTGTGGTGTGTGTGTSGTGTSGTGTGTSGAGTSSGTSAGTSVGNYRLVGGDPQERGKLVNARVEVTGTAQEQGQGQNRRSGDTSSTTVRGNSEVRTLNSEL